MQNTLTPIEQLLELMSRLRDPDSGCPWDRVQDWQSLVPFTLEEAYEVAEAIQEGEPQAVKGELGDLLFQVIFYSQIAKEQSLFDFDQVAHAIAQKLIRRHPHVFGEEELKTEAEVAQRWEQIKAAERREQPRPESVLDGIAKALPALKRAQKLQSRAAHYGFDWKTLPPILDKLHEELAEVDAAIQQQDAVAIQDEVGDLLFVCVNLARWLGVDAEAALTQSNHKFIRRFQYIEAAVKASDKSLGQCTLDELEALWQQAKCKGL